MKPDCFEIIKDHDLSSLFKDEKGNPLDNATMREVAKKAMEELHGELNGLRGKLSLPVIPLNITDRTKDIENKKAEYQNKIDELKKSISETPIALSQQAKIDANAESDITVSEMIDKPVTYNGEKGTLYQDGQSVIFKVEGKNKEYELGNVEKIKSTSIKDFNITHEQSVVSINDDGGIKVRETDYVNNYSNPFAAINKDADGNIVSVNLETTDGKKRTFRGNIAEDIAYQIHLKEITKNNETRNDFERFINEDGEASKQMEVGGLSETATTETSANNAEVPAEKTSQVVEKKNTGTEIEPDLGDGRTPVTLSGNTESERQVAIEQRKKETKGTPMTADRDSILERIQKYNNLTRPQKRQSYVETNKIKLAVDFFNKNHDQKHSLTTNRDGSLELRNNPTEKRASGKPIKNTLKGNENAIVENGKSLMERGDNTKKVFNDLLDADVLPVSRRVNGEKMSEAEHEATIQDIMDGIPSQRAENYLNSLEKQIREDNFDFGNPDKNVRTTLNDALNITVEKGEPMTPESIEKWLSKESELTPEEQTTFDNIDNLITHHEQLHESENGTPAKVQQPTGKGQESNSGKINENGQPKPESSTANKKEPIKNEEPRATKIPDKEKGTGNNNEPIIEAGKEAGGGKEGKYEAKARKLAEKIMDANIVPDWLKIDDENVSTKGASAEQIKKALAEATIKMGQLLDKGIEFSEAIKEAVGGLVDLFGENNRPKIEEGFADEYKKDFGTPPPKTETKKEPTDEPQKIRSVYKNVIDRSKLSKEQKDLLKADPSSLYTVLPNETAKQIALGIIEDMGVENAVAEASRKTSNLEPVEKVMVLGAAMDYYAGLAKEAAKNKNENAVQENSELEIDANEKMQEVARTLAGYGTDFGRAINIFNEVYKLSNLALEKKLKNTVAQINAIRNPQAEKDAKVVEAIIKDDAGIVNGIGEEMTEAEVLREADLNKKIAELEKEVKDLRDQIKNVQNAQTGSKNNPLKITRTTNATEYDKRMKDFKQRQRTGISKDDLNDLTYFGLYHLENGATKFADWIKIMAQKFNGFREYLEGIYHNIKQDAIDKGIDNNLFDTEAETQKHLQDLQAQSDARKIANKTKQIATAKLRQAQENNADTARVKAPLIAAERIRKDAEKNLDLPTTKNEQTYLKRLVQVVQNKAREYYKETEQKVPNVNDWLQFAIANGKADYAIWERTQEAVEAQIDEDENLSDEQKEEVKDFLSDYQDSIFETLLTTSQKDEIIRQKLIDAGFTTERTINGKVTKAVDWNKVIGNAKNIKDAKAAIVKSITDLGFTVDEAANEINSILADFDNKVTGKKTKAINSFLNKGVINKAKNALGLNRKSKVQKLIDMNNKGILDDSRVKDVLAKDLGIISLTEDDLQKVRELSDKIDKAIVPFIKKKYEEQLQYLFDSKSGNLTYLENREFVMNNRLTSLWNQIQNLTGYLRVLSTYIATSIKTGSPVQMAKVFKKQWKDGVSDAMTVLMGGHVSRGTAFSDLTRSTEGEARVRYLEQGKGKLLGLPDLYVRAAGKTFQVNPFNALYRKIKYVGRLMESADTIPSNVISGLTQYWQIRKQIHLLNPELNSNQVEKKAYAIMYSIGIEEAKGQAIADLKESGVDNPTQYEINRASHEIVERKRNELIADEFYATIEKLKPTAEQRLIQQGNSNPTEEEIINEAYSILGRDEPLDIVARGERQALRETGKKTTAGITALVLVPVDGVQKKLKEMMLNKHGAAGKTATNVADAAFNQLLPFANSIGRWIEMGLELTPYGVLKGLGYKGYGAFTKKTSNTKLNPIELNELGDDYIIRSIQGTSQTLAIMFLMGMLKGAGGDDEEEDKVTGTYQGKDFKKERIKQIGNPQRSLDIGGRKFPLDLLGAAAYPLMMYSDFLDRRTDENERHGVLYTTAAMYMVTAGQSAYGRIDQYGSILNSVFSGKDDRYMPQFGKLAGSYLGAQFIPFNRFQQEIGEVWNPKSTASITFGENLLQQLSIVGGISKNHPAFDYRGREYDKGDIWVGSPDGVVKMFTKSKTADEIDKELAKIDFGATDAYRETKDEENYKYTIENNDGTRRFMTTQEYYDFKKATAREFDKKLALNFETIKEVSIKNTKGQYDENETMKVQREAYSALLNRAKENALALIQAETNHIPNVKNNKIDNKKQRENILKQKKQQVNLIND